MHMYSRAVMQCEMDCLSNGGKFHEHPDQRGCPFLPLLYSSFETLYNRKFEHIIDVGVKR